MNARSSPGAPTTRDVVTGTLAEGALFGGRYRIMRRIAAGGMGAVYEVVHTETGRRRALKAMHPHLFQSDEMRERFKREARIAAMVDSEHIVDVSDAGVDEATGTPFLVMELLQGEDLGQRLKRVGRLPASEVVACLYQVALALDRTHAKAIVHRDLKPENVFLSLREDRTSRVKILDFGVAKLIAESATSEGATRSLGTPLYMAPEQFRVGTKLTPAVDIYALGMMAYTLLVGQPYWSEEARGASDVIAYALVVVQGPQDSAVERAARAGVTLPRGFDAWFERVAAPAASDRPATASEAVAALGAVLAAAQGQVQSPIHVSAAPRTSAPPPSEGITGTLVTRPPAAVPVPPERPVRPATVPLPGRPSPGALAPVAPVAPPAPARPPPGLPAPPAPNATLDAPNKLEPFTASTGAATMPLPAPARRTPLLVPAAVLAVFLLGGGLVLAVSALRGRQTGAPAAEATSPTGPSTTTLATAAEPASTASAASSTPVAATSGEAPPQTTTPESPPSGTAASPATTATAAPAKPATSPTTKPTASPTAKPIKRPLLGRD